SLAIDRPRGGDLRIGASVFTGNQAIGGEGTTSGMFSFSFGGSGVGGALDHQSFSDVLSIADCHFTNNLASGGASTKTGYGSETVAGDASGGAVYNSMLELWPNPSAGAVSGSEFTGNQAVAGSAVAAGDFAASWGGIGQGGGMYNDLVGNFSVS